MEPIYSGADLEWSRSIVEPNLQWSQFTVEPIYCGANLQWSQFTAELIELRDHENDYRGALISGANLYRESVLVKCRGGFVSGVWRGEVFGELSLTSVWSIQCHTQRRARHFHLI